MVLDLTFNQSFSIFHACMTIRRISPPELAAKRLPSSLNTEHTARHHLLYIFDYDYAQTLRTLWARSALCGLTRDRMRPPLLADRLYMESRIKIQS